jgi:hypothetical protein
MKKALSTLLLVIFIITQLAAQTQQDTIFNRMTATAPTIDGADDDACWDNADWQAINQIWLPEGGTMSAGDFEGKFKVSWDADYLYLLVEVIDNIISDDHSDPLTNWWDDDCLEIFIDENRSKGYHQDNTNAFAYHVSLTYDAIDMGSDGNGINYKDHIDVLMVDMGDNTYVWELAIKIYADDYNHSSPEDSRVTLTQEKLMGFALAYCDNDETSSRENFIGSIIMPPGMTNVNYQTADHFGSMKLVETNYIPVGIEKANNSAWSVYPVPSSHLVNIETSESNISEKILELRTVSGQLLKSEQFSTPSFTLDIEDFDTGIYLITIKDENKKFSKIIIKQ